MSDTSLITPLPTGASASSTHSAPERAAALRAVAQDLEATFLAEMLKHAKFGEARGAFGGGPGEEQFASMLRMEHARAMAEQGGIGLAESLFNALATREGLGTQEGSS